MTNPLKNRTNQIIIVFPIFNRWVLPSKVAYLWFWGQGYPQNFNNFHRGSAQIFEQSGDFASLPGVGKSFCLCCSAAPSTEVRAFWGGCKTPIFFKILGGTLKKVNKILGVLLTPKSKYAKFLSRKRLFTRTLTLRRNKYTPCTKYRTFWLKGKFWSCCAFR